MSSTISTFIAVSAALVLVGAGCGKQEASVKTEPVTTLPSVPDSPATYTTPKGWKTAVTPGYKVTVDHPANWKQEYEPNVALFLVAPDATESGTSFNVTITPAGVLEPLTDAVVLDMKKTFEAAESTVSVNIEKLQTAAGLSYLIEIVERDPESGEMMHTIQLYTEFDIAGVVATASASEGAWPTHEATLRQMLMSLRLSR